MTKNHRPVRGRAGLSPSQALGRRHELRRRTALKLLGLGAAGMYLPFLRSPAARAASGEVPLRLLFIDAGPGCRRGTFAPSVAGPEFVERNTVVSDWVFRDVMAALAPYRERATMFQHLDMLSAREDPSAPANAHVHGLTHMLTADSRYKGSPSLGSGPSIDQYIAQALRKQGAQTLLTSLELRATDDASAWATSEFYDAYSAPGQRVPFLTYVPDVWDRIFPMPLTQDEGVLAAARQRQDDIYGFVRADYERLQGQLSGEDRTKLSQMLTYRAELHARAFVTSERAANRPDRDAILQPWAELDEGYQKGNLSNRTWKTHGEVLGRLAAAALHTDVTRVVNLSIDSPPGYEFGYRDGDFGAPDAHEFAHRTSGDDPAIKKADALAVQDRSHAVVYEVVATVLEELARLPETDGKSLLDHTLVVVYSHIAEGSHDLTRLPWVVIGDAHGRLKTGQYIRFAARNFRTNQLVVGDDSDFAYQWNGWGRGHGDLFVTIAQAMGVAMESFGNASLSKGAISEMLT